MKSNTGYRPYTIALAGNANVGKSAIFNQLTGLVQETGNWAGKTVGVKEGVLVHHGREIRIVDLPGIYSFTTYSPEEQVTREYILTERPDAVINVIDATSLERNLYFTLQLHEMNVPLVIALNFADIAKKKHINIDTDQLSRTFGSPVVSTIAIKGIGVHEIVDEALKLAEKGNIYSPDRLKYGPEVESRIAKLSEAVASDRIGYPVRFAAIKLLEGDSETINVLSQKTPDINLLAEKLAHELTGIHGEDSTTIIAAERYALAAQIARDISNPGEGPSRLTARFDSISLHPIAGYAVLFATMALILIVISIFGGWMTEMITGLFESFNPHSAGFLADVLWNGAAVGFYASLSVALGFILPFFLILGILGESGYLPRIAFLMDRPCHLVGLHGQASMPLIVALGCNVPACMACRIMESRRDRLIATFLSTMVPCSARTSVVLGLVGAFVGWQWAVGVLAFQFVIIFLAGYILNKLRPSTAPGIIMEIPEYRVPSFRIVWRQAWFRFKDFLTIGVPLIIAGSVVIESLRAGNLLDPIMQALTPLTVWWLGLPAITGMLLIFGILRKEATLALLISFAGGASIASVMSPQQMVVFTIVIMLYIPCVSTIAALVKETGYKFTAAIIVGEVSLALLIGGLAYRLLGLFMG